MAPALLALTGFLPAWDLEKRSVNVQPIVDWMLERLRQMGHPVESLADLHAHLTPEQAIAASRIFSTSSVENEARRRICRVVQEAIPELVQRPVWLQSRAYFRILLPDDTTTPVPPHTDFGFGHRLQERNLWFSLTNATGNAALHALPLAQSLQWMARTNTLHGVLDEAPEPRPLTTRVGDLLLFTPLHVHRAFTPDAHQCRVSFDVRIIPAAAAPNDLTFSPLDVSP